MDILLREAPFRFPGGIQLPAMKEKSTADRIRHAPIPKQLILPLKQHIGQAANPLIKAGDKVLKGQILAKANDGISANVHAPTSGTILSIGPYPVPHPSTQLDLCINLIPDGEDMWIDRPVTQRAYQSMTDQELIKIIRNYGIVGLGGAVFPADIKIQGSVSSNPDKPELKALIINGAECEPYISCDDMLMREYADEIIEGAKILMQVTGAARCMFAIEDNKPLALNFVREALRESKDLRIELYTLPSIYPQGGEKQLLQSLTGEQIPAGGLPLELGYLMFNVATVKAIRDAVIEDQPMLSRVVTVSGDGIRYPQNIYTLIGTPVYELVEFCGGYQNETGNPHQLIMGGPLMGVSLQSDAVPVVKAMNCLLVANEKNTQPEKQPQACIRCGECAHVCPASLLPQQLYWYSKAKNYPEAERFNLADCIECGACDLVCPSHIPLVQYFRNAKGEIREQMTKKLHSDIARERFEFREDRLHKIALARAARLKAKKERANTGSSSSSSAIDEIMQRVKNKKLDDDTS
jgi:electron transport complex protein RnfC